MESMLDDGFVFLGCVGELATFPDVVGNRFLHVGVFTVRSSCRGDESVKVVGRGDNDGVDVLGLADFAVVFELGDLDAFLL